MARKKLVIRGLVIPAEWDQDGRIQRVRIAAFDETEYLVADTPEGQDLIRFAQREVEVVGRLTRPTRQGETIRVERFRPVDSEAGPSNESREPNEDR
jgi:hypothetical protein